MVTGRAVHGEILVHIQRFGENLGLLAAENSINNVQALYFLSFSHLLELSVLEDEHIVEFAETVKKAVEDGELKARLDEDTAKEQVDEAKRL